VTFRLRTIGEARLAVQAHEPEAVLEMHVRARDPDAITVDDHALEGEAGGDDLPHQAFVGDHEHLRERQQRSPARRRHQAGQALAPPVEHGLFCAGRGLVAMAGGKEGERGEGEAGDGA
jgi:hypothetical protein